MSFAIAVGALALLTLCFLIPAYIGAISDRNFYKKQWDNYRNCYYAECKAHNELQYDIAAMETLIRGRNIRDALEREHAEEDSILVFERALERELNFIKQEEKV